MINRPKKYVTYFKHTHNNPPPQLTRFLLKGDF